MSGPTWAELRKKTKYALPCLALVLFLLATLLTWHITRDAVNQLSKNYFDFRVQEIVSRVEKRLQAYEQVLLGVKGIYEFARYIDRHRFRKYVASLRLADNYPGFEGVGFSLLISAADLDAHLADVRTEGFPEYSIKPEGQRDPYSSILYLEPFSDRNLRAFGYDMFSEPVRREAMEHARDTGNAALSGKVRLVQESGKNEQAGFLMYVPVYRKDMPHNTRTERREHIIGWVYSPFRMKDFMGSLEDPRSNELGIRIFDNGATSEETLMFDSFGTMPKQQSQVLHSRQGIEFAGHAWTIDFIALPGMGAHIDQSRPVLVAIVGVSISLLATWLVWLLVNGRERAISVAMEMNRELIETQSRLSSTLDAIPDLMCEVGLDGRYYDIHAPRPDLLMAPVALLLGKRITEVMPPEASRVCMAALQEANEQGVSFGREFRLVSGQNHTWFELSIARKQGVDGQEPRFIVLSRDITQRKYIEDALRLSEKRWQFALDSAGDGIWDWNVAQGSVFFSGRWKEMLGFSEDEIGSSLDEWSNRVHPDDRANAYAAIQAHWDGETQIYSNEHRMKCKDGSWKWILDRGVLIERSEDGKPLRMIGTHHDITKRQQYIEWLCKARELAEEIARAKSSFLANMSHEIRTPMNAIIGLSQLALNKEIPPEIRDYLEKIFNASYSLMAILNDILDLSKIEAKCMVIEYISFDLDALLGNLEYLFAAQAEEKRLDFCIELDPDTPRRLIGDALHLQQVLTNFLGNAIKFTEQGSVMLRVKLVEKDEKEVTIHFGVEDTGIGIAQKDIYKLFHPFSQIDGSITRRFGGTGLGLSISRELLGLMGSKIQVESTLGQGAHFYFKLRCSLAPQIEKDEAELHKKLQGPGSLAIELDPDHLLGGVRILVAEDDVVNQQVAREFLELSSVVVTLANNGAEALEWLEKDLFDGVLMDIHMPVMDGLEATRRIRENPDYADLPIIALTAEVTSEERERFMANGMNDFIAKPFQPEALVTTLLRWIKPGRNAYVLQDGIEEDAKIPGTGDMALQTLPGFDFDNIMKILNGNGAQLMELLFTFVDNMAGMSGQVKDRIEQGAFEEAHVLVHRIKGTAGSLGATELLLVVEQLDEELKTDPGNLERLKVFEEVFERTMSTINALRPFRDQAHLAAANKNASSFREVQ